MTDPLGVTARADAWSLPPATHTDSSCKAIVATLMLGPTILFGAVGALLWGAAGLFPAAMAALVSFLVFRTSSSGLLASLRPTPVSDDRFLNLVAGVSADIGVAPPRAYEVEGEGPNALIFLDKGRPAIGVTRSGLSTYTRTELESVVAHCLVRLDPHAGLDRMSLRLGGLVRSCARGPSEADDARAAAVTRYPPGVAKAIERSVPAAGRFSHLWFVAEGGSPSSDDRVAALTQL